MTNYILSLERIEIYPNIGFGDLERSEKQLIFVDIEIFFSEAPKATINDELDSTICYNELAILIKKISEQKEYHLIEHLGYEIYRTIKSQISHNISVKITKPNPPTEVKSGPSSFTIKD